MLDTQLVNRKLKDFFADEYVSEITIRSSESKVIILVETKTDYALVTIKDFTNLPIGDYDVFVENRVKKTTNTLQDMAEMIKFLQLDTEKTVSRLKEKINDVTGDLIDLGQLFSKMSVLASQDPE